LIVAGCWEKLHGSGRGERELFHTLAWCSDASFIWALLGVVSDGPRSLHIPSLQGRQDEPALSVTNYQFHNLVTFAMCLLFTELYASHKAIALIYFPLHSLAGREGGYPNPEDQSCDWRPSIYRYRQGCLGDQSEYEYPSQCSDNLGSIVDQQPFRLEIKLLSVVAGRGYAKCPL